MDLFIYLFFGHMVGDYFLQNSWMAFHKKVSHLPCFVHCIVYTTSVCLFLQIGNFIHYASFKFVITALIVFASHWFIDRYELVDTWFRLLNIRSWNGFSGTLEDYAKVYDSVIISFGALVYVAVDNTLHLLIMFFSLKYYLNL